EGPIFGIGQMDFDDKVGYGLVAHNSFVHSWTELGFFGGTAFLSVWYLPLWRLNQLGSPRHRFFDPEQKRLYPYMMVLVTAYAAGMLSISRAYIMPSYLLPGLAVAYLRMTAVHPPLPPLVFNRRLLWRLALVSLLSLAMTYTYCRIFVRYSGG